MLAVLVLALLAIPQSAQAPAPASKSANYVVGPQDVLTVTVFNEPQLSGRFRVENDGQFTYPFLGRIQAGGTSVAEIAALLTTGLAERLSARSPGQRGRRAVSQPERVRDG